MIFELLTRHLRRFAAGSDAERAEPVPAGAAEESSPRRRAPRSVALWAGVAASAVIGVVGAAWWLTELQASSSARGMVVIDVPPPTRAAQSDGSLDRHGGSVETAQDNGRGGTAAESELALLAPAPQPALIEEGPYGLLPKIAADGRTPWRVYARPSDAPDTRPRIAVIITEIGLSTAASQEAIRRLPPTVTLAIDPYAAAPEQWAPKARRAGHEILLSLPLESAEFPFRDPGPRALLTSLAVEDNIDRLQRVLSRCSGYVGVVGAFGRRFEGDPGSLEPVLKFIGERGLIYVGGAMPQAVRRPEGGDDAVAPRLSVDVWIDDEATPHGIDRALARLEAIARERAVAVGLARNYPLTIARLATWAALLKEKDIALVPISAIAERQLPL